MKKLLMPLLLIALCQWSNAQLYNNEWIDYSKPYYKFLIGSQGVYHITKNTLNNAGLGHVPAEYFQLWRNGVQVPLFTSVPTGLLGNNDFIEFYGFGNTGETDRQLYLHDSLQMNKAWSLYTDTAAYFLTVNSQSANRRYQSVANDTTGNMLLPESWFTHRHSNFLRTEMSLGMGIDMGERVHASAYETAEGWGSRPILPTQPLRINETGLHASQDGPEATLTAVMTGNAMVNRTAAIRINDSIVTSGTVNGFKIKKFTSGSIPVSQLLADTLRLSFSQTGSGNYSLQLAGYTLQYARTYNFNAQPNFYFELPAGATRYLSISNFNSGNENPVLFDTANNERLIGIMDSGFIKFVLPASTHTRKMILANVSSWMIRTVGTLQAKTFIDFLQPEQQGNYLIISHPRLNNDGQGNNPVEQYRLYRNSATGGNWNARVIDIDQLIDQFAFGVKHHPISIKNFAAYARDKFISAPQHFFLIGKGVNYYQFRIFEYHPLMAQQALVPVYGFPSSDNLLMAGNRNDYPQTPIGRLAAITGAEVKDYLEKVKQYEYVQATAPQTLSGKAWMKNIAQLTGGFSDPTLYATITGFMNNYHRIAADTLMGGRVLHFNKNDENVTANGSGIPLSELFKEGISLLTYFGHSSPNSIEFNLDNPENYQNTGKYPVMMINGCNAGNLFVFDSIRNNVKNTLSEKFILAPQKGAIGYIASTHYGLPNQLHLINQEFYQNIARKMYGRSLGEIMKTTMEKVYNSNGNDYIVQTHIQQIGLHGDPALLLNPQSKADFIVSTNLNSIKPVQVSIADSVVDVSTAVVNIGRAINDSITLKLVRQRRDGKSFTTLHRISAARYSDTVTTRIRINPLTDRGLQTLTITADADNNVTETDEQNNSVVFQFTIDTADARPIWPVEFSIVNQPNPVLYASTASSGDGIQLYTMELDTTARFNSPLKIRQTANHSGGLIRFLPGISFTDSTVYYWRVTTGIAKADSRWKASSFVYIKNAQQGFHQSHYHQYKQGVFKGITQDSSSYRFALSDTVKSITIRTGIYPFINWDQIDISIDNKQIDNYGCQYGSLQFVVYHPITFVPWKNNNSNGTGKYGSVPVCGSNSRSFFEFPYTDTAGRRKAMQFLDSIPNGHFVSITNLGYTIHNSFVNNWLNDTIQLGKNNSLRHKMAANGLYQIDSFIKHRPFIFFFKKGDTMQYKPRQFMGATASTHLVQEILLPTKMLSGQITSAWMGPAKSWSRFMWNEKTNTTHSLKRQFQILGQNGNGEEVVLANIYNSKDTSISHINAALYPMLKIRLLNGDSLNAQATQLVHWQLTGTQWPEGAILPVANFSMPDSLTEMDSLKLLVTFANVSQTPFDSLSFAVTITNDNGRKMHFNNLPNGKRLPPLAAGDSITFIYPIPLQNWFGNNMIKLEINAGLRQPEMYLHNNTVFKAIHVANAPVCPGSQVNFAAAGPAGCQYQWQMNNGSGFQDIVPNALYNKTDAANLTILQPGTHMYGWQYRCKMSLGDTVAYSPVYQLKFASTWLGNNTNWNNPANWSCGSLPDAFTDVHIKGGVNQYPIITQGQTVVCRSARLYPGTQVLVNSGGHVQLAGKQ